MATVATMAHHQGSTVSVLCLKPEKGAVVIMDQEKEILLEMNKTTTTGVSKLP